MKLLAAMPNNLKWIARTQTLDRRAHSCPLITIGMCMHMYVYVFVHACGGSRLI